MPNLVIFHINFDLATHKNIELNYFKISKEKFCDSFHIQPPNWGVNLWSKRKISITCNLVLHFKMYLYMYFQNKFEKIKFETKEKHNLQFGLTFCNIFNFTPHNMKII